MRAFADLLDRLSLTPQRNGKIRLLTDFIASTPDPDRGYAIAAITGDLSINSVKPAALRALIHARTDESLFELSYDYVGDMAETISLMWPGDSRANAPPNLAAVVETLNRASKADASRLIAEWLDALPADGRFALLKLVTGGFRVGVSSRLAKAALAHYGEVDPQQVEEIWHGLDIPYQDLFAWLENRGPKPDAEKPGRFRPVMLAHAIDEAARAPLEPNEFLAEWKWDGVRVQATAEAGVKRLYSRTGDDISAAFPDIIDALNIDGSIDGELLIYDPDKDGFNVQPFSELQKRLNRKTVSKKLLATHPAFIRAYDALALNGEDLRVLPFARRRARLEDYFARSSPTRMDLSPLVPFSSFDELDQLRMDPPNAAIEGVMLKRRAAAYVPGRPKGEWWKWKRDPFLVDAVMMYAQRGHGKRSSLYSDFTFGVWTDEMTLTPVGKAYFGFTDEELRVLDKFVREHTEDRFGPVRQVTATLDIGMVLEIAFEGLNRSSRHKSGLAMRFPRIHRLRLDKPPHEADRLASLIALLPS